MSRKHDSGGDENDDFGDKDDDESDDGNDDDDDIRKITSHQSPLNLRRESLKARLKQPFAQLALCHD